MNFIDIFLVTGGSKKVRVYAIERESECVCVYVCARGKQKIDNVRE